MLIKEKLDYIPKKYGGYLCGKMRNARSCCKCIEGYSMMGGISMYAMNLVDVADVRTNYGILFCGNDEITENIIQTKICEIKEQMENEDAEWVIDDVIKMLPRDWKIELQCKTKQIII